MGLKAIGVSGDWRVSVEENINGKDRWFLLIEGVNVSLSFEIATTHVVDQIADFLSEKTNTSTCGELVVGKISGLNVSIFRENCFVEQVRFWTGSEGDGGVEITVVDEEFRDLSIAIELMRRDIAQ